MPGSGEAVVKAGWRARRTDGRGDAERQRCAKREKRREKFSKIH